MKRTILLILSFLFLSTTFKSDSIKTYGWYQQSFPNLNGSSIKDITFLDSLTGCAVTNTNSSLEGYILRTSNGGDNWNIVYTYTPVASSISFNKIAFATDSIGFATVNYYPCFKTTNAGLNWFIVGNAAWGAEDFAVINKDTLLSVNSSGLGGGVYRSTNGGASWQIIFGGAGTGMPSRIYMYDKNLGFFVGYPYMRRTTNGGFNWTIIPGESFTKIQFVDSLTGWRTFNGIKKTTDGGVTWFAQQVPPMHYTDYKGISILNKDTIWVSGPVQIINSKLLGAILKTTNGGINWGYQYVDTAVGYSGFSFIKFIDKKHGWAFPYFTGGTVYDKLVHTTSGGNDTTYFTGIKIVPGILPERYLLGQNYPNPFNPATNIPFELKEPSHVVLEVYDVNGRVVKELVNGRWGTGKFIADFDAADFPTGVYFYKIVISGETTKQTFSETKRMLMIK